MSLYDYKVLILSYDVSNLRHLTYSPIGVKFHPIDY